MRRSFPFEVFPWRFTLLLGPCLGPGESAILKGREGERSVEGERPRIIILDDEVVSRIAAGEVVERPASVVKELVENSLDAGATRVEVDVEEGGKRLIRVADDGCGMSEEEALLALQRHATSKIRSVEDLERIVTLGFRGEALPSIAAVSKMEVVTRRPEDEEGTMVLVEGGVVVDVRKVGCPPGTMVTVRHLFYNTPARLKFLKGAQTELAHISEWMTKFVLAWPEVSFRLRHKGQVLLSTRRGGTVYDAVAATLGMEALRNMVEIGAEGEGFTIRGLVSLPTLTRAAKSHQYLIVNKRAVKPLLLSRALQEAYRGLIPQGRHPVAVVWMEVEPHLVDVNVHPAKVEVKFRDEHKLLDALVKAVADSLRKGRALSKPEPERPKKEEPKPKPVLLQKPIPSFGEVVKQKAGIRVFPPALERLELRPPGPDVRDLLS
ncbi:MAG TPA: DNA mismatch repair endonuclease MutL, partial [Armatimonadetes bacterium]|nr:DNA mismatch repair endonuclease MutL [Armatimonadota bacterium]